MESLAILSAAVFLVLLLLVAWHARVRAVREALRLEAEAARGRELESIAMDAAGLLAATLQSIQNARAEVATDRSDDALCGAEKAAGALSSLFSAARLYLRDDEAAIRGSADGCVRVAIAIARSRGVGVSVRGDETLLSFHGRPRPACELVIDLLEASRGTLGPDEFVEVELEDDHVRVLGGSAGEFAIPEARLAELGWSAEPVTGAGRYGVRISAEASQDRPRPGGVPQGVLETMQ